MDENNYDKENIEFYDAQVEDLKRSIKNLKKLKKRKEKIRNLEREKNDMLKRMRRREK